ncbi:MAG: hypothetical protein H0X67_12235 [Acidobacteria bacterium]|nr:hypothetical protein [Acidobacteriota bacterium]
MYILVQHTMTDPASAWTRAQQSLGSLPSHLTLHHCFPAPDGTKGICVWEAESIPTLQGFLDDALGAGARNEYYEVVNKEGVAVPPSLQLA